MYISSDRFKNWQNKVYASGLSSLQNFNKVYLEAGGEHASLFEYAQHKGIYKSEGKLRRNLHDGICL